MTADVPPANIARVLARTAARSQPGGGRVVARIGPVAPLAGGATQLRVTGRRTVAGERYVRVLLAQRPNGSSGWIAVDRVRLLRTAYRVTISRRARTLTVTRDGRPVRRLRVVVGAAASPTPRGQFAVSETIRGRASDFTGAWILPLTAFSGTYRQFDGGPGRVAIHGRGGASLADPLGTARSHGCVRTTNRAVRWLATHVPPGAPVTIR